MGNIAWFKDLSKKDIGLVGGKGANLSEMYNADIPIPPGFCITVDAYNQFLDETGIDIEIYSILSKLDVNNTAALHEAAERIQEIILDAKMPSKIRNDIINAYDHMNVNIDVFKSANKDTLAMIKAGRDLPYVAVRSSATAEDAPEHSFAGQNETYLNIRGNENLVKAVQKCWASLFGARSIFYRVVNKLEHEKVFISVVVQKMVNATKAGVIFTANPATSDTSEIVIEAGFGLGEAVVSGSINPDTYVIDKNNFTIKDKKIARQDFMIVLDQNLGRNVKRTLEEHESTMQKLNDNEIIKLAKLAKLVEIHYEGFPQDLEFAIEGPRIFIVQTRAITTLKPKEEVKEEKKRETGEIILNGLGAGPFVGGGAVKIVREIVDLEKIQTGDVLVTKMTNPDMAPVFRKVNAIVTDEGGISCIEGDAKLLTNKGFVRMADIGELLTTGDEIKTLSVDAKTKKVVWRKITLAMKRKSRAIKISPYLHPTNNFLDTICITSNHKMPVLDGNTLLSLPLEKLIGNGKSLFIADKIPQLRIKGVDFSNFDMNRLMYLCGAIFSDGHIVLRKSGRPMRIMFSQKVVPEKEEFINEVLSCFRSLFNAELINYTPTGAVVNYKGMTWQRGGSFECSKAYPAQILHSVRESFLSLVAGMDEEHLLSFLGGFIDGDGHFNKEKSWIEIYVDIKHEWLLQSLLVACLRLNSLPEIREQSGSMFTLTLKDNVEKLTKKCKRVKAIARNYEDRKLFDFDVFRRLKLHDWRGSLYNYNNKNTFVGVNWLLRYLEGRERFENLLKIKELAESELRMRRIRVLGETEPIDVYNITMDAPTDEDHNYIIFTKYYTPLFVYNCHAAIVSREMGVPCVVGTEKATQVLKDGEEVTVDGREGKVYRGKIEIIKPKAVEEELKTEELETVTEVKVIVDMPEIAERAAKTGADGVGLLRVEFLILSMPEHPFSMITTGKKNEFVDKLADGIRVIAKAFEGKPVWYRTMDAPTDEFRRMKGGENEPKEDNPMMGWRSIRRDLDQPEMLTAQFEAIKKLHDEGLKNIGVMIPLVTHVEQIKKAKEYLKQVGLEPLEEIEFGVMIETPASVQIIKEICEEGIDFVSFGTNDLTQFTLAVDRNNAHIQKLYDEMHPAVLRQIKYVIDICKKYNVETSVCGQSASRMDMVEWLVKAGIDSVSPNPDAVKEARKIVAKTEKRLLLGAARQKLES